MMLQQSQGFPFSVALSEIKLAELILLEILYIIGDATAKNNLFTEVLLLWFVARCSPETKSTALQGNRAGVGERGLQSCGSFHPAYYFTGNLNLV